MTKAAFRPFVIAEVAQAHDGSLGLAHAYIDALAGTGVDAVKFQVHIAEAESSAFEPFRVSFAYEDKTRYDYWKRTAFSKEQWQQLKQHCEDLQLEFLASPFSVAAVELLEELAVRRYKVASAEIDDYLMLDRIARTGKEIWLSSGMSSFEELDRAVAFLAPYGNKLAIMQCTTSYPTSPEQLGLNVIGELKRRYRVPVGFSDHSACVYAGLAAVALGAELLEVHAVFDRRSFGPDSSSSLTIDEIGELVRGVRYIEKALNHPIAKTGQQGSPELKKTFGKSLALRVARKGGHAVTIDDLEGKKPAGRGIASKDFQSIVGRKLNRDMRASEFLTPQDLA